jgi:hypothetical protein
MFLLRVFGLKRTPRIIIKSLLITSILYGIVILVEPFLICRPLSADWDSHVNGTCGDQIVSYVVLEIIGLFLDLMILVVPLPIIKGLFLRHKKKVQLMSVFSIGIL